MTTKKKMPEPQDTFTKEALLASGYFDNRKDALAVLIDDGEEISIEVNGIWRRNLDDAGQSFARRVYQLCVDRQR